MTEVAVITGSAAVVGVLALAGALIGLRFIGETFGKDLDYVDR